ncbi:hypothetical protein V565_015630 [Rhizoctonia solani 123E]|uniref:Uncharacterized protein n=1 Tax=Rhizoctonia solani 123E TaxID=1423351 RepID=A0A074S554_9AGAM|nr:hypothetical protein V565_015630 [Rhizoctonia solani 123E]
MPAAPMPAPTEPLRPRKGSHARPRRAHVPQALALKQEADYAYSARRRSSLAGASTAPVVYSFLPSASPGAGWTISPTSSVSPSTPAPISLFASTAAVSPAVYARRPSAPRVRRVDGDATRPSFDSSRLHFPLPPTTPPRPRMSVSRTPAPAHPLSPTERPAPLTTISRASLAQVAQPLPAHSTTLEDNQMYDELKTFVFGAASVAHDVDMDDNASDAASAYNPLSPALRPDGAFTRRSSKSAPRRPSRAGLRDGAASIASGAKRRNSRAWIPSDSTVARPEIAVTSITRDQDGDDEDEDHDELIRMMDRAKMRAIDDGARRPSLPINIPDSAARRGSRDTVASKPLPDTPPRRPSGALATAGFDLDFILAAPASFPQANPSGQGIAPTPGVAMSLDSYQQQSRRNSAIAPFASAGHEMQTLDVEDTFLSMVRQLDTEYARRRNKWSFRQEPRRAYDYDLDPDEEVWGCEPVGTFWVGKDRAAMHSVHEGPTPVIIKPLQPQMSPKSQAPPEERRSDIRLCRDPKRPTWRLSVLPAGSQSTVPVRILLATKAMHLKVASAPLRTEGRRRGHTIHSDSHEMGSLASSSGELGRIEELPPHPKTSHAVAFDTLTDAELDHAGRRHITFSERIRRAFGSESPPPTHPHAQPSFSPPWLMMAPQSAKEEQMRQVRELHTAFRAVGLLTPPKPGSKDQPHAIKAVRTPEEKTSHHETPASILEDIPTDALCMILPLWQFRGSSTKDEGLGELASVGAPVHEREYLLVYFVPLGAADTPTPAPASRLSKKRSRGNMDRQSSNSISVAASWAKGRRTAFHVVARVLTASELCATGLRHPSTLSTTLSSTLRVQSSDQDRKRRAFPSVIAMCNGTGTSVEFVPEGLDRLGLCTPSYEWQSESERFPGLTPVGVEVVEMVWAGCIAVLGIGA